RSGRHWTSCRAHMHITGTTEGPRTPPGASTGCAHNAARSRRMSRTLSSWHWHRLRPRIPRVQLQKINPLAVENDRLTNLTRADRAGAVGQRGPANALRNTRKIDISRIAGKAKIGTGVQVYFGCNFNCIDRRDDHLSSTQG